MIKIQIKSVFGKVLFEYEKEDNTVKETVEKAVSINADLRNANLRNANLRNANLRNADLRNADLGNADLRNANLRNAYLRNANLRNAYLGNADLRNANLRNAYLGNQETGKVKIKKMHLFSDIYMYDCIAFISEDNKKYIKLGCFTKPLKEWKKDFWNNDKEFPNDNSEKSQLRLLAFKTAKKWFKIVN